MLILDASVAAKLFIAEADSDLAEQLLTSGHVLTAPDLVLVEVGNALHKAWRRDIIDDAQMDRARCASFPPSSDACSPPPISSPTRRSFRASSGTHCPIASTSHCIGGPARRLSQQIGTH